MSQTIDIAHLQTWIGREQITVDDMSVFKAQALANALQRETYSLPYPEAGVELNPAWQWLYFVDIPSALQTGQDGHPKTGGFLPPVPLPRRMWAAGNFNYLAPIVLGVTAEKRSVVTHVELKEGSTGTLVFVTVKHVISQQGRVCLKEEQNIVYREMPTAAVALPPGKQAPEVSDWLIAIQPDPVLLFRFSALTYNGHRIHYDRQYAIDDEFYPALVVHGPLQATLLANTALEHCPNERISEFSFRAQRPLFDTDKFSLCGKREGDELTLWTQSHDGFIGMKASATLSDGAA